MAVLNFFTILLFSGSKFSIFYVLRVKMELDVSIEQIIFCPNSDSNKWFWNQILLENALKISKTASELIKLP